MVILHMYGVFYDLENAERGFNASVPSFEYRNLASRRIAQALSRSLRPVVLGLRVVLNAPTGEVYRVSRWPGAASMWDRWRAESTIKRGII